MDEVDLITLLQAMEVKIMKISTYVVYEIIIVLCTSLVPQSFIQKIQFKKSEKNKRVMHGSYKTCCFHHPLVAIHIKKLHLCEEKKIQF